MFTAALLGKQDAGNRRKPSGSERWLGPFTPGSTAGRRCHRRETHGHWREGGSCCALGNGAQAIVGGSVLCFRS